MASKRRIKLCNVLGGLLVFNTPFNIIILLGAFAISLGEAAVPVAQILLLSRIFNRFASSAASGSEVYIDDLLLWLVVVGCGCWVLSSLSFYLWSVAANRQAHEARSRSFKALVHRSMSWFDVYPDGISALSSMHTTHLELLQSATGSSLQQTVVNFATAMALFVYSMTKSWKLALVTIASLPVVLVISSLVTRNMPQAITEEEAEFSSAMKLASFALNIIDTIKCLTAQPRESAKFNELLEKASFHYNRQISMGSLALAIVKFGSLTMFVQGLWYGSVLLRNGGLDAGTLLGAFFAALQAAACLSVANAKATALHRGSISGRWLQNVCEDGIDETSEHRIVGMKEPRYCGEIKLKKIYFSYSTSPSRFVLNGLSMFFEPGQLHFIIGASGSGKSTIGQLLTGLYPIENGNIYIEGMVMDEISPTWLRDNVLLVEQTSVLFLGTLVDNVRLPIKAESGPFENSVNDALIVSMLAQAILDLPDGLETQVGFRGNSISGGQRQRVALARAYIRNPTVLILDEATTALDPVSRRRIMAAIRIWRRGKTTIIITHETALMTEKTDYFFRIENGKVKEQGFWQPEENAPAPPLDLNGEDLIKQMTAALRADQAARQGLGLAPVRYSNSADPAQASEFMTAKASNPTQSNTHDASRALAHKSNRHQQTDDPIAGVELAQLSTASVLRPAKVRADKSALQVIAYLLVHGLPPAGNIQLAFGVIASLAQAGATPAFSYVFAKLVGVIITPNDGNDTLIYALILLAVVLTDSFLSGFSTFVLNRVAQSQALRFRCSVYENLLAQPKSFFEAAENKVSTLAEILSNSAEQVQPILGSVIGQITVATALLLVTFIWGCIITWQLTLITFSCLPLLILSGYLLQIISGRYDRRISKATEKADEIFNEVMMNMKTIKLLSLQAHFVERYEGAIEEIYDLFSLKLGASAMFYGFSPAFLHFLTALILRTGQQHAAAGDITLQQMFTVLSLITFGFMSVRTTILSLPHLSIAVTAANKMIRLLSLDPYSFETRGDILPRNIRSVRTSALDFSYPSKPDAKVLQDVELDIDEAECVAIVGTSGSGKSTLASLILKLYQLDGMRANSKRPTISLGERDSAALSTTYVRKKIGYVPQVPVIVPGTVWENIFYGLDANSSVRQDTRLAIEFARAAGCEEFVQDLPQGYNTLIGQGGITLSGGQAQRLCLARALCKAPQVLILDEATSALDAEAAAKIHRALKLILSARRGRGSVWDHERGRFRTKYSGTTMIIITHDERMMTIADRIVVMDQGRIVEEGRFDQLIRRNGPFAKLLRDNVFAEEWKRLSMAAAVVDDVSTVAPPTLKQSRRDWVMYKQY